MHDLYDFPMAGYRHIDCLFGICDCKMWSIINVQFDTEWFCIKIRVIKWTLERAEKEA